jgi:hypothetical protein
LLQTFARRAAAFALACGLVASLTTSAAQAGPASSVASAAAPANGLISYVDNTTAFIANPDGSNRRILADGIGGQLEWAPDGSRFAYLTGIGIASRRLDGTGEVTITDRGFDPAWSADGTRIFYRDTDDRIHFATADGTFQSGVLFDPGPACVDEHPTAGPGDVLVFDRICGDTTPPRVFKFTPGTDVPAQLTDTGFDPALSQDGQKVAYVVDDSRPGEEVWTTNIDGSDQGLLVADAVDPSWSPDGSSVVYNELSTGAMRRIDVTTKVVTPITGTGIGVKWQPIRRNVVDRVWGQDHVDTAIATSQFNYADAGQNDGIRAPAKAVVLSRDDTFLDALVGSAFAARSSAPLLITRRTDLDPRVEAEIKRVLGPTGTVFLLGGPIALNQPVEDRLHTLGYTTERIFGQTHFDTALAIDGKLSTGRTITPHIAIVATGVNFFDALAAGAAAGAQPGTVIVLTNGDQMPAQSAAYLNTLNPSSTLIVSAGGPGDRALINAFQANQMPSWPSTISYAKLVGNNEKDSALLIAQGFFSAPNLTAIATNRTWMDALTGGAMVGFNGGPLLITDPTSLYPGVQQYLNDESGSVWEAAMLGGPVALSDSMKAPIGDSISVPGQWDFQDHRPGQAGVAAQIRSEHQSHIGPPATATITR